MKQIGMLAILFTVLLAAVIQKELSRPDAGALRDQVPLERLGPSAFTADAVRTIEVDGPGGSAAYSLRHDGTRWIVHDPFVAPASAGVVLRLLDAVATARGEVRLTDATQLAEFDLSAERATSVTLRGEGDAVLAHFAIGKSSGQQGAFVRLLYEGADSDSAYAVTQDLRAALGLGRTRPDDESPPESPAAKHFHDLDLPSIALEDATRVELSSPHWTVAYEKTGPEWDAVEGAPDLPSKPSGVRDVMQQLAGGLRAATLVDPARRGALGFDEPQYRVRVTLADGSTRGAVGVADRETGTYYVRLDVEQDPDVVYEATRYNWERLFPPGSKLVDFASLDVEDEGLGRLEIERAPERIAMTRKDGRPQNDWELHEPAWPLSTKGAQLRSLGALLRSVRPVDWYAAQGHFSEEIVLRWGAADAADDALSVLRIGQAAPGGDGRLAILPGAGGAIVVLSDSTVERLAPEPLTLFEPRPLHGVVESDITAVVVRAVEGAETFRVTRGEAGAWSLTEGGGDAAAPADAIAVGRWLDGLLALELTERSDYLGPASVEITVEVSIGEPRTFGIGTDGGTGLPVLLGGIGFMSEGDEAVLVPSAESLLSTTDEPMEEPMDEPVDDDAGGGEDSGE